METLRKELSESKKMSQPDTLEVLLDQVLAEIDRLISPDFYTRLKRSNPELSARIGEANRKVSRVYRGGDLGELRDAIYDLRALYYKGKRLCA